MQIILGKASDGTIDQSTYLDMLKFRHRMFSEKLKWDVQSTAKMEFDIFDTLNPYYMIARANGQIHGCWRLMPTTGPYMLKDTFPQLLNGQAAPQRKDVWEVSRFAMATPSEFQNAQTSFNETTLNMFRYAVMFAKRHGINHFVSVNSLAFEKALHKSGVTSRRFSNTTPQRIGRVRTVACWIDIDENLNKTLFDITSIAA